MELKMSLSNDSLLANTLRMYPCRQIAREVCMYMYLVVLFKRRREMQ